MEKRRYEIWLASGIQEQLDQLPLEIKAGVYANLNNLMDYPMTLPNAKVIEGSIPERWELTVSPSSYSIIYEVDEEKHVVTVVELRSA